MQLRYWATSIGLLCAAPAAAEPLGTLWTLEAVNAKAPTSAKYGERFFEQRLLPIKLVRMLDQRDASNATKTLLYLVYTAERRIGYCTFKDRSLKNQAATLFIPVLDKRPCFVDQDGDGRFDATFSVFDKYNSMATPSGDLSRATPLAAPIAYEQVDPHLAPETMRIAFALGGSTRPERVRVSVAFDKAGRNRWENLVGETPRRNTTLAVLNAEITVQSVVNKQAEIAVHINPDVLVTGSSGGVLTTTHRLAFLR